MGTVRAHIVMPEELAEQIDSLVGKRGRSAFLVETARAEVRRRRLLEFLQSDVPVMRDEDHPELAALGTDEWVRKMRAGWEPRRQSVLEALESDE
ncbi:hypothetical protein [Granulicella rosea]|uniref:hypothetical protein n=1 Tax=Granulicella rosea TaxID=474952 RepID=UPI000B782B22|nr:hypothetical protein [Granulicella rosea]